MRPNAPLPSRFDVTLDLVESLTDRFTRDRTGLFLAEGARFLFSATGNAAEIVALVVCPSLYPSGHVAHAVKALDLPTLRASPEAFHALARQPEPQGVLLVARQRWCRLKEEDPRPDRLYVGLDGVRSPGNVGTILRTAEATGVRGVFCVGPEVDPYDPAAVRATMGAIFSQRLFRVTDYDLAWWSKRWRVGVLGAAPAAKRDFRRIDYRRATVMLMGSERAGLRPAQERICHTLVRIPMSGPTDSLNVAVAAGLMMYAAFGQRHPP